MLFVMTDIEKRRSNLLAQTRTMYSEKNHPPAIHPRYKSAYLSLYDEGEYNHVATSGTFLLRIILAFLVFVLFFVMDYRKEKIGTIDSQMIIEEVQKDLLGE